MKLADSQIVLRSTQLFEVWLRSFPTPPKHPLPLPSTSSIPPLPLPHYLVTLLVALCHPHSVCVFFLLSFGSLCPASSLSLSVADDPILEIIECRCFHDV